MDFANKLSKHPSLESYKIFLKMLTPFAPHTTEKLWEMLGEKQMISIQKWPEHDESKINLKVEAGEEFITEVIKDTKEIQKLSKIDKPEKIIIFVTPHWKYEVYNTVLQNIEMKELMQNKKIKKLGNVAVKYYKKLQKKKPLEELFLTSGYEHEVLEEAKEFLEKEFDSKVEIIKAEDSKNPKALVAEPSKPGILVE
jgi:leucyl-tRNA synthetase